MANIPDYRFRCQIMDAETGEIVTGGSIYLSKINPIGECESVDTEVAAVLRHFKNKAREVYEETYYPKAN